MNQPPANPLSTRGPGRRLETSLSARWRAVLATVPLIAAFAVHYLFWPYLQPNVWFLFFPAMFVSSWLAGVRQAIGMTVICALAIWFVLVPAEHANATPQMLFPASVFVATGTLFSMFHARVKAANAALARALAERRIFAALVDNSSDFIGIADPIGTPIYVNPSGRRLVGLAPEYPVGQTRIPDYYPPEERRFVEDVIVKAMIETGHWHGETRFRNFATGEPIAVDDTHFMIRDPETSEIVGMGTVTRDISEVKRLEHSLREATADLSRAQEVAEVGSWRLDMVAGELRWSDETYRIFGLAIGKPVDYASFLEHVHPDDRAYVDAKWHAALRGAPYDIEHRIVVGSGEVRWVREKAELAFDDQGSPRGGIGIIQNITERRRLEEELRLAVARSTGILSISADAIITIDDDQKITMFNEGAERIFGYLRSEAIGSPLERLIPEAVRATHRAHVEKFASGQVSARRMGERTMTITGRRKNGETFPADASISKLEVEGTRILTVSLRDVTEERRSATEHRLLADVGAMVGSSLDYEQVLTNLAQLVVRELADFCVVDMLDESGKLHRHSAACRDPADRWITDVLSRVTFDADRPYLTGPVMTTRRPALLANITHQQLEGFAHDEHHLAALEAMQAGSVVLAPLIARGAALGAIGLVARRTSRPYGEADVHLVEELARRAALSIDNARLYRATQRAVQSRDEVLGIVAHDLRNPLNAITLHAALIHKREDPQLKRRSESIERSARRMDRLIQDLLDVARLESGHMHVEQARVATRTVLADAVDAHRPHCQAARLHLRLETADDLPDLWADRDRILQILENLIGNACKFTPAGGDIVVGAAPRDHEVVFSVADTGRGIAPEHQPHVFDRFWQTREARRGGAGLGLPIVKGIVEAHGGAIWFESALGSGTTFYFTIPTYPPQEQQRAVA